jgi:kinesin family protein 4/21/27
MEAPSSPSSSPSPSPSPASNGGENCCVKVALHIRPLIADERAQGCKDCVTVVSGKPQVRTIPLLHNVRKGEWVTKSKK